MGQQIWISGVVLAGVLASQPVMAQERFAVDTVQFNEDTIVEFEFKESHGAKQSSFGVLNLDTNEAIELFREVKPYDDFSTGQFQSASPGNNDTGTPLDYLGTVEGGTVQNRLGETSPRIDFTFRANTRYVFYLESTTASGQTRRRILQAGNTLTATAQGGLDRGRQGEITGVRISLDDSGLPAPGKDGDFDDFVVEAGGFPIVPACPPLR